MSSRTISSAPVRRRSIRSRPCCCSTSLISELTAGELKTRGHYQGSNVSYNLKKLVEAGYVNHERSSSDKRSVRVRLTPKGQAIRERVDALYNRQLHSVEEVVGLSVEEFERINKALTRLERFWTDQILYRL